MFGPLAAATLRLSHATAAAAAPFLSPTTLPAANTAPAATGYHENGSTSWDLPTAAAPAGKAGKSPTSMALARCGDRYGDAATTLDGPLGTVRDKRTGVEEAAAAALAVEGARSARAARSGEVGRCGDDGAGWWATS